MLDKKQIVARIASHGKTAKKLRDEIQVTLCEIAVLIPLISGHVSGPFTLGKLQRKR